MPDETPRYPFVVPPNREAVTGEPEPTGTRRFDLDVIDANVKRGGGHVPEDYEWPTNPKQRQEEEGMG